MHSLNAPSLPDVSVIICMHADRFDNTWFLVNKKDWR